MQKLIEECEKRPWRIASGILIVWLLWPVLIRILIIPFDWGTVEVLPPMGQYGDSYGAFTALATAIGLLGVAATFLQQRKQIELQQQQIDSELGRFLAQQRAEDQERLLRDRQTHQQQRIDRFYSHLNWWEQASRQIEYEGVRGAHALCRMENDFLGALVKEPGEYYGHFMPLNGPMGTRIGYDTGAYMGAIRTVMEPTQTFSVPSQRDQVPAVFMRFYEERIGAVMGHVFRMQSDFLKYLRMETEAGIFTLGVENRLINSYKALLTDPDMHLLMYFGLSGIDDEFRELIRHYGLLDWLTRKPREFVCHRIPELVEYYPDLLQSTPD